jgi:hypothetical protein
VSTKESARTATRSRSAKDVVRKFTKHVLNPVMLLLAGRRHRGPPLKQVLGTGTRAGELYTLMWTYWDEPLLSHLGVTATGPGGTAEPTPFGLYHG